MLKIYVLNKSILQVMNIRCERSFVTKMEDIETNIAPQLLF